MTLAFLVIAFFAMGFEIRRWWTLAMPVTLGTIALVAIRSGDTPIPFLIVLATAATAFGVRIGRMRKPLGAM